MDPPVFNEIRGPPEGLAAVAAHVGPLPGVDPLVLQEAGALPEGLPALAALVRLLACVDSPMLSELGAPAEQLATVGTPIGLGPTVDALVLGQAIDPSEGLATVITVEGQVASVHSLVLEKFLAIQEIPATRLAGKGLFQDVKLLMVKEVGVHLEGPPTFFTVKRFLSAVDAQVLAEACVLLKPLPTFLTLERFCLLLHLLPLLRGVIDSLTWAGPGLCSHMALPVLIELRDPPKDLPTINTLPALHLTVNSLVLHKEDLKPKGIPTLFTGKVMFYGQILGAPSPPLRVPILFDLRAGLTGPRRTRGCHLLWLGLFTHRLVWGQQDVFRIFSSISVKGLTLTARVFAPGERPKENSKQELGSHVPVTRQCPLLSVQPQSLPFCESLCQVIKCQ